MLEGECRRAINTFALEPAFGFLHEPAKHQTAQSLVYSGLCDTRILSRDFKLKLTDVTGTVTSKALE